jgi:hypothetical protein
MAIQSHILEGHGESEDGWGLDFYAPDFEEYKEVRYTLGDVMGGMNSIPIPFLGLRATVDCGFIIHYNAPKGTDCVINEFELNPEGNDTEGEWFEIYDPNGLDMEDWKISSSQGKALKIPLVQLESENEGEYTIFSFSSQVLENGEKINPFSPGDGLILYDGDGNVVDKTPVFRDPGAGDNRTWQRSYDGAIIWKLEEETKLTQNAPEKFDAKTEILNALKSSFQVAWSEFIEKDLSIDAIIELLTDWIDNFIDMVLTMILDAVYRVYVFLDLALEDATGTAGGGLRLSLGMDAEGVVTLLRWIIDTLKTFVYNIMNPADPENYLSIPKALPEHMFIRFELYLSIGTPKIIKRISEDPPKDCRFAVAIQANIPALVNLLGWDWGDWEVVFGAYLDHFPSRAVSNTFGTSSDSDTFLDLWFIKARVYELV